MLKTQKLKKVQTMKKKFKQILISYSLFGHALVHVYFSLVKIWTILG